MSENKFEKLSFWQLLDKRSVEVPIIQRDYAQGRATKEKVRNDFLEALKNALSENPIELDFVYGSEKDNILQPLDGQQRLTTLFLIHWFIANKERKLDVAKEHLLKFIYKTRISSREFCKELIDKSIDYQKLLPIDKETGITIENQLSKTVKNASWFVISWKNDPTISAMLIMLDAIQAKFKDSMDLWQKLTETDEDKRSITFLYIKLENFGLSDDLYIKMNARGKALTPFENFKSRFGKYIEKNGWENAITNPQETFVHKIDTVWTDLFWGYRDKIERNVEGKIIVEYKIDDKLTKFITGISINYYAQGLEIRSDKDDEEKIRKELERKELIGKGKPKIITDFAVKRERIERRIAILNNNPNEIAPDDFPTKEAFEYLVKCLDIYYQNDYAELKSDIYLWKYCVDTLFKDFIQSEKSEWQNRVVFYAQTAYLLNCAFDKNTYNDWIRVVRNIVENSTIDSATTFISAINLIHELTSGCSDIYDYLSKNTVKAGHAGDQVKEEIEKAKIIFTNPSVKQVIHDTEDTNFCKGKIDFALYSSGYDIENPNPKVLDKDKLENICKVINEHLSKDDITNEIRRVLFTLQGNDFYDYWTTSWLYAVDSPKRCLIENIMDLKGNFANNKKSKWRDYLKELLNELTTQTLENILIQYQLSSQFELLPNWKQRLIKEKDLLNHSQRHYIAIAKDNSCCWLIPQSKVSNDSEGRKKLKPVK